MTSQCRKKKSHVWQCGETLEYDFINQEEKIKHISSKGTRIGPASNFSSTHIKMWCGILEVLRENDFESRITYLAKLAFQ